jgi:hypothetical protein
MKNSALILSLAALVSLTGAASASLEKPSIKLPTDLEPANAWRTDIVVEAHSPYSRVRITRLKERLTVADHFDLNARDARKLQSQGAKVEQRLRSFKTAGGRRLLALESLHRDKSLFTGYVNGPKNSYAFLAAGLTRTQVMQAVESLEFPGEIASSGPLGAEAAPSTDNASRAGRAENDPRLDSEAMPMPEELRDSPAPLRNISDSTSPQLMYEPQEVSPWPKRLEAFFTLTMVLVGIGFVWRLVAWGLAMNKKTTDTHPGSATTLPPFQRKSVATQPLRTPVPPEPYREPAGVGS